MVLQRAFITSIVVAALPASAAAEEPSFIPRRHRIVWTSSGLLDGFRAGLQYELAIAGARHTEPRRGWKLIGTGGGGISSIGSGHLSMDIPANGGAGWLAARAEYGAGALVDGISGEFAFALSAGPVVDVVEGITRLAIAYRPGIVMRIGRFHMGFAMVLEHQLYGWSDRVDLVEDGWIHGFTPGFEVGLGVAF